MYTFREVTFRLLPLNLNSLREVTHIFAHSQREDCEKVNRKSTNVQGGKNDSERKHMLRNTLGKRLSPKLECENEVLLDTAKSKHK